MKKRKINNILLIIVMVCLLAVTGYFAFRSVKGTYDGINSNDKNVIIINESNTKVNDSAEEINLGDPCYDQCYGTCVYSGTSPSQCSGRCSRQCSNVTSFNCTKTNCGGCESPSSCANAGCHYYDGGCHYDPKSEDSGTSTTPVVTPKPTATPAPTATPKPTATPVPRATLDNLLQLWGTLASFGTKVVNFVHDAVSEALEKVTGEGLKYGASLGSGKCIVSVSSSGGGAHVSKGDRVFFTIAAQDCKKVSYSCYNADCSGGAPGVVSASVQNACDTVSITVTGDGGASAYASVSAANVRTSWSETLNPNIRVQNGSIAEANASGSDAYGINCRDENGKQVCDHVYVRGSCGYGVEDFTAEYVDNSSRPQACYGDGPTLELSSKVTMATAPSLEYPFELAGVIDCSKPENVIPACIPNAQLTKSNDSIKEANACESNVSSSQKEQSTCDGDPFYTIECTNTATVKYDFGDDCIVGPNENSIYAGQGFKFGITVTTVRTCEGKFDKAKWREAYVSTVGAINTLNDLKSSTERVRELQTILESLKESVRTYNAYQLEQNFQESSTISLTYKVNGESQTFNKSFSSPIVVSEGTGNYKNQNIIDLGVSDLENPSNWEWSTESNPRVVKLLPQETYIDRSTGKEAASGLAGGNKIYIDPDADPGKILLGITTNVIDGSLTIVDNMCSLSIGEKEILYRPINLNNPFINSSWQKGENWVNALYDFTNIIDKNTWSKGSLYVIDMPKTMIKSIRESNRRNSSAYMGLCNSQKEALQDDATKRICSKIK